MDNYIYDKLTPKEIIHALDEHIIGQYDAKRAVAIAMRNRWRRMQIDKPLRNEITPKNILMIGPTGVGKTEIARRVANLSRSPFIKVEATKFTEIGYVGRDVESIIRDITDIAIKITREEAIKKVKEQAEKIAENRILHILLPLQKNDSSEPSTEQAIENPTQKKLLERIKNGQLDDKEIDVELNSPQIGVEIMAPPGMEDMTNQLKSMFKNFSGEKKHTRQLSVKKAFQLLSEEEAYKLINEEDVIATAIESVEQNGIVFLDEIDKITSRSGSTGPDISRQGVQRDLLPLIEGSTVSTKYGMVKTEHILFIASGAFHLTKPSDLIPELQGRLPIRVELKALNVNDFERILTEPNASLTKQYIALIATEGIALSFKKDSIAKIAEIAWQVNNSTENIGARRLHTVMEKLLETLSYEAADSTKKKVTIDANYVDANLQTLVKDEDLSRYIL